MLSLALPLSWCLRCWRYIFVIVSISVSCLYLVFWTEVRFATDFSAWYRVNQTESDGHLTLRKEGMKASELTLFERLFIIFVKIKLCECKLGDISEICCTFGFAEGTFAREKQLKINFICFSYRLFVPFSWRFFSFPTKQALQSCLGDFLLSYAKRHFFYNTGYQIVWFVLTNLRASHIYFTHNRSLKNIIQIATTPHSILYIPKSSTPNAFNMTRIVYSDTTIIKSIRK